MELIERWAFKMDSMSDCYCDVEPDKNGSYVMHRDHLAAIEALQRDNDQLVEALTAAMDFINKHPADPDISHEQTEAWLRLLALRANDLVAQHANQGE